MPPVITSVKHFQHRIMNKNRKLITFDWAIKRLLRSKANFGILEGFLSELLKEDITIIKINRFNDIAKDTLDEWIYFLKNEEIKENFTAKGLKEAEEKLSIMKLPEDEQKAYEHYKDDLHYQASMFESSFGDGYNEGEAAGMEKGIEKGIEMGVEKTTKTIALKLMQQGVTIENIAAVTGLSVTVVEQLIGTEQ